MRRPTLAELHARGLVPEPCSRPAVLAVLPEPQGDDDDEADAIEAPERSQLELEADVPLGGDFVVDWAPPARWHHMHAAKAASISARFCETAAFAYAARGDVLALRLQLDASLCWLRAIEGLLLRCS